MIVRNTERGEFALGVSLIRAHAHGDQQFPCRKHVNRREPAVTVRTADLDSRPYMHMQLVADRPMTRRACLPGGGRGIALKQGADGMALFP